VTRGLTVGVAGAILSLLGMVPDDDLDPTAAAKSKKPKKRNGKGKPDGRKKGGGKGGGGGGQGGGNGGNGGNGGGGGDNNGNKHDGKLDGLHADGDGLLEGHARRPRAQRRVPDLSFDWWCCPCRRLHSACQLHPGRECHLGPGPGGDAERDAQWIIAG
jgi:hypothetical protein